MKRTLIHAMLCLCLGAGMLSAERDPEAVPPLTLLEPEGPVTVSEDGTVSLRWSGGGASVHYRLERSRNADFADAIPVYEGGDVGTFVSGLTAGVWHYRLAAIDTESGQPVPALSPVTLEVQVEFVSEGRVWLLMSAGGVTFLCIVGSVLLGFRHNRSADGKEAA